MIKIKKIRGFTLLELLIVITLIAILSVVVLVVLNPIEQYNKAKDARAEKDISEILSAYERYVVNKGQYPWMVYKVNWYPFDAAVLLRSDTYGFGICKGSSIGFNNLSRYSQAANCNPSDPNKNELIANGELKTSIMKGDEFVTIFKQYSTKSAFWVVKNNNSNVIYICYIPKSKLYRSDISKMGCVSSSSAAPGLIRKVGNNGCLEGTAQNYAASNYQSFIVANPTVGIFKCIPEI